MLAGSPQAEAERARSKPRLERVVGAGEDGEGALGELGRKARN